MECREIGLYDAAAGEWHRADVLCGAGTPIATVLELQHSSISEQERMEREAFYRQKHCMFWLVHLHDQHSFTGTSFRLSLGLGGRTATVDGHNFEIVHFASRRCPSASAEIVALTDSPFWCKWIRVLAPRKVRRPR